MHKSARQNPRRNRLDKQVACRRTTGTCAFSRTRRQSSFRKTGNEEAHSKIRITLAFFVYVKNLRESPAEEPNEGQNKMTTFNSDSTKTAITITFKMIMEKLNSWRIFSPVKLSFYTVLTDEHIFFGLFASCWVTYI